MERKVCFILDAGSWGGGWTSVRKLTLPPPHQNQWARAFIGGGKGLHVETAQSALTVILKLVIGGLTSVLLTVLSTVNLQFQGRFVSISLRPVLGIVAAYMSWLQSGHHGLNFFYLAGVSVSTRQLTGRGPEYDL